MSPNAYINWNEETRLLEGFQGEEIDENPTYTWNYSDFDEYHDIVTPSMYHFMAAYVQNNMTKDLLYELQGGDYCSGGLEEDAVYAYVDLPINERIELHEQELVNLNAEKIRADEKHAAFSDAIDRSPFDATNPIYVEYTEWVREGIDKWTHIREQVANEIHRENEWRGGHEEGESDMETIMDID